MSSGKHGSFAINNSFVIVVVLLQISLISFIFTVTKARQVEQLWICLMVPRLLDGRWYELKKKKMQEGRQIGIQCKCTKVNFNKAAWGLVLLFYHLLASAPTACWELSHLFHHTHPAT